MDKELEDIFQRKRSYASYFDFGGDRRATEIAVVDDWVDALYPNDDHPFVELEHNENPRDPPDVVLVDRSGQRHGIEVTEFVDGLTVKRHAKDHFADVRDYHEDDFRALLLGRIAAKSRMPFKDCTCTTKRLIVYSDEPMFLGSEGVWLLHHFPMVPRSYFDEVWFMIPPALNVSGGPPDDPNCRIFELQKGRPNTDTT